MNASVPRPLLPVLLLAVVVAGAPAADPQPPRPAPRPAAAAAPLAGVKVLRDVQYAQADQTRLLLDLYLPEKPAGALPVIVWVHGGGWRAGDKQPCPAVPFVKAGYAVASINYRLTGIRNYPAQIHDCKAAIRWLRAKAGEHGLDGERIGAWGASAGGHLVALLGTSGGVKELEGELGNAEQSSRVQCVVDFFGPTDLTRLLKLPRAVPAKDAPELKLLGGTPEEQAELARLANPITFVDAEDPPFLIVHGDQDRLVPVSQSQLLHDALTKAGVPSALEVVKGAGHGLGVSTAEVRAKIAAFFERHLKGAAPATQPASAPAAE